MSLWLTLRLDPGHSFGDTGACALHALPGQGRPPRPPEADGTTGLHLTLILSVLEGDSSSLPPAPSH